LSPVPIATNLLDMVDGAAFTVTMVTNEFITQDATDLHIASLAMAAGTTFDLIEHVTLFGTVGTSGTITLSAENDAITTLVTNGYSQPAGELILPNQSTLLVHGSFPVSLSGHTTVTGNATVEADTVQIDGPGVMEVSAVSSLTV